LPATAKLYLDLKTIKGSIDTDKIFQSALYEVCSNEEEKDLYKVFT